MVACCFLKVNSCVDKGLRGWQSAAEGSGLENNEQGILRRNGSNTLESAEHDWAMERWSDGVAFGRCRLVRASLKAGGVQKAAGFQSSNARANSEALKGWRSSKRSPTPMK
jgi:hypothetical protein